jgi:hypothetical protein
MCGVVDQETFFMDALRMVRGTIVYCNRDWARDGDQMFCRNLRLEGWEKTMLPENSLLSLLCAHSVDGVSRQHDTRECEWLPHYTYTHAGP